MKGLVFKFLYFILAVFLFSYAWPIFAQDSQLLIKIQTPLPMNGGIMVYAVSQQLQKKMAFHLSSHFARKTILLPSGTWEFYAIGFKGKFPLEGEQLCSTKKMALSMDDILELEMNPLDCMDSFFGASRRNHNQQFFALKIFNCEDLTHVKNPEDTCAWEHGPFHSYLVEYADYDLVDFSQRPNYLLGITSLCINNPDDSRHGATLTSWHFPTGSEGTTMSFKVHAYDAIKCYGKEKVFLFDKALVSGAMENNNQSKVMLNEDNSLVQIYLK